MSNELKVAIAAAKAGANAALKYFNRNPKVTIKPDNTPVTQADKDAQQAIMDVINNYFPGSKFLAEETETTRVGGNFWVIDPIDGTKNFIRGLPFWGIEIAFVKNNKIVVGVSFAPSINEMLYAQKGKGAFLNGQQVHVSKIAKLSKAFLNHGTIIYFQDKIPNFLTLLQQVNRERGFADFYGYHLVATGHADIMIDAKTDPWDDAALKVIIEEAGGKVTNFKGEDWQLSDTTAVATNKLLHDEVIKILNEQK